jgi:hypothetical protein
MITTAGAKTGFTGLIDSVRTTGALTCEVQHGPTIPSQPVAY